MASVVDIANIALDILGKPTIASLTDNSNAARAINATYDMQRRALLTGRPTWRFSIARASVPALTSVPVSGPFTQQFEVPSDCLRVIMAGDTYPGLDLSDYRQGPTDAGYSVEGRMILCDYGAPLSVLYVSDVTDTTLMDPWFCLYFGASLAWMNCERITNSDSKQQLAAQRMKMYRTEAVNSNALVNTPQFPADDTYILSRMQ